MVLMWLNDTECNVSVIVVQDSALFFYITCIQKGAIIVDISGNIWYDYTVKVTWPIYTHFYEIRITYEEKNEDVCAHNAAD